MSARGKTACVSTNIAGPRGEGKPIKLIDWRRKSFARHSGGRAEKISGAGSSRRLQPLNGLRSLEAAAATGNEVVSMGCKHQSCCWRILALPDVASIVGS
jgi:hypothetical protein